MKIIDLPNAKRIDKKPHMILDIISCGDFIEMGFVVKKIQLKSYIEKFDEKLGPYSLITLYVKTDKGSIEMIYDEGFRGDDALESARKLVENIGISGLVIRSIISLKHEIEKNTHRTPKCT